MPHHLIANPYIDEVYEVLGSTYTADGGQFVNACKVGNGEDRVIRAGELQESWYALCDHFYGVMDSCPNCDVEDESAAAAEEDAKYAPWAVRPTEGPIGHFGILGN